MYRMAMVLAGFVLLTACGDAQENSADANGENEDSPQTGYEQALQKARDVEDDVMEADEKRRQVIDEQGKGDG